jgi:hypothetical protein
MFYSSYTKLPPQQIDSAVGKGGIDYQHSTAGRDALQQVSRFRRHRLSTFYSRQRCSAAGIEALQQA